MADMNTQQSTVEERDWKKSWNNQSKEISVFYDINGQNIEIYWKKIEDFIEREIQLAEQKAREEGYKKGFTDGQVYQNNLRRINS